MKKLRKVSNFIGFPDFCGPPVFLNSLPKSGTNLVEQFFINVGYKRNLCRCLNESNIDKVKISPSVGRFYVGHLFDDTLIDKTRFSKVFVKRNIWFCLRSYVNYMYIDKNHPVSSFILGAQDLSSVHRLFFTSDNPNNRPLLYEYLRFNNLKMSDYDLTINYDDFISVDEALVSDVSVFLGLDESIVVDKIQQSCEGESYTKNSGKFDFFEQFTSSDIKELKEYIELYQSDFLSNYPFK